MTWAVRVHTTKTNGEKHTIEFPFDDNRTFERIEIIAGAAGEVVYSYRSYDNLGMPGTEPRVPERPTTES